MDQLNNFDANVCIKIVTIDKMKSFEKFLTALDKVIKEEDSSRSLNAAVYNLSFSDLRSIFLLWMLGVCISALTLLVEIVMWIIIWKIKD